MSARVHFTKMHGAGNDYIYVNTMKDHVPDPRAAAIAWSHRHTGIGSDGLVLIGASPVPEADFSMRIFNADGSEALMCGNASRCIGKYLYEKGITTQTQIKLLTRSGVKTINLNLNGTRVESVTVDMLSPLLADEHQFVPHRGLSEGTFVSMGNPHYVIFTDEADRIETLGPKLERHPAFPQRCNIELATVQTDGRIRVRVWERGSGVTKACGTGACAVAVAAAVTERAGRRSSIVMDGGVLDIEWRTTDSHVLMTGPAEFVFEGEIDI